MLIPFANGDDALVEVMLRAVAWRLVAKVDVADVEFGTENSVVVAVAVEDATANSTLFPSPLFACTDNFAHGEVVATPKLPATVATVVVPVTTRVPLIVEASVIASPKVVLFSTVNVEAVVVERVTAPVEVRLFKNTSPSASTKNLTASPTDAEIRLPSATEVFVLTTKVASDAFEFAAPIAQEENVCADVGARDETNPPANVEVADVEVA